MHFRALRGVVQGFVLPGTFINDWARKIHSLLIEFADVAKLGGVLFGPRKIEWSHTGPWRGEPGPG